MAHVQEVVELARKEALHARVPVSQTGFTEYDSCNWNQ